ncbi:MAG: methyltransferase domain-containing protein [Verrucomicrobia bacterium]|nr:methyltransferase domain-containing protein [Verrucomicrobiota bacterium]
MTEWNAAEYDQIAGLQLAMANEVLSSLPLSGTEQLLDVGCGEGKITAAVAARLPSGSVVGVDASRKMIDFASTHFAASHPNLSFAVADARRLEFEEAFDGLISFNALHWVQEQDDVLRGLHRALKPRGTARLRFVPAGPRTSLEDVIEAVAHASRWAHHFPGASRPYFHPEPEAYAAQAEGHGFQVESVRRSDHAWNFGTSEAFAAFARVTFVEWTRHLPETARPEFIQDVLTAYRPVACDRPGEEHCFKFYQMDLVFRRPE